MAKQRISDPVPHYASIERFEAERREEQHTRRTGLATLNLTDDYVEGVLDVTCRRWFRDNLTGVMPEQQSPVATSLPRSTTRLP